MKIMKQAKEEIYVKLAAMEYLRSCFDLFSFGSGSIPAMSEMIPRKFEKHHTKTYIMLERLKEKIKKEVEAAAHHRRLVRVFFKKAFVLIHISK